MLDLLLSIASVVAFAVCLFVFWVAFFNWFISSIDISDDDSVNLEYSVLLSGSIFSIKFFSRFA